MSNYLHGEIKNGMAIIRIGRPEKLNAINHDMWLGLKAAIDNHRKNKAVKVLFFSSTQPNAFSVGADLEEFALKGADKKWLKANHTAIRDTLDALMNFPKPTVAAVTGLCIGGGMAIAMACDIRYAAIGTKFSIPPAKMGLVYPFPEVRRLVEIAGYGTAADLFFSGKTMTAQEARRVGLVNDIFKLEEFDQQVNLIAGNMARLSATSFFGMKEMLIKIRNGELEETKETEALSLMAYEGRDFKSALATLTQRRDAARERAGLAPVEAPPARPRPILKPAGKPTLASAKPKPAVKGKAKPPAKAKPAAKPKAKSPAKTPVKAPEKSPAQSKAKQKSKSETAKKPVKKAPAKKPVKKTPAKKPAAKKAPVKKAPAKKPAAKKAPAKKAPAKKPANKPKSKAKKSKKKKN